MLAKPLLNDILANEALTRGLADPEARMLIEWVVEEAEYRAESTAVESELRQSIAGLCLRARTLSRFVGLWCHARERGAACQLAAAERFNWPLPTCRNVDPCELMDSILTAESAASDSNR